jgi:hypothetical protein
MQPDDQENHVQAGPIRVEAPGYRSATVIVLLVRALMAVTGMALAAVGAPLVMVGFGIPILMLGMGLFFVAVDDDW